MSKKYVKIPTVYQMEATECGAASLSMIFSYFGKHLSLEEMRIETGVSRDGCNAKNIMRAGKKHGFEVHAFRKEPEGLLELQPPCIIHWNFNHFVVFEGVKGKYAFINDPAVGRRRLSMEELDFGFTGVVLTFQPTDGFTAKKGESQILRFMERRLKGQRQVVFKLLFMGLLLVFPGLMFPIMSQVYMDEVLGNGNTGWLHNILAAMLLLSLMQSGLSYYRNWLLQRLQNKMILISTYQFLQRLFRLPIFFFDQRYAGDLAERVGNNANASLFLAGDLAETALNFLVAFFYLVLLLAYSPVLLVVGLFSIVVKLVTMQLSSATVKDFSMKYQQDSGKLSGAVCAGLSITDTIKASGVENEYIGRIYGFYAKTVSMEQRFNRLQQIVNAVPATVGSLTDVIILLAGAVLIIRGQMTIGMLVAFSSLYHSFCTPVDELVSFMKQIQTIKADISRVEDIMNYPEDETFCQDEDKEINEKLKGNIELSDISFGYSRLASPLVENFSFTLENGKSVAFVGASGSGKSTVSKIVSGLYQPWSGEILFDGRSSKTIPKEVWNASIATVSQNITLFSGTVRDNLTMWNKSVLEADMIRAAKDACIHDVITSKPGAYDYVLTEGAANLSGGQRQRLEIARALASNPTVLVMDEATSALDPIIEKQIIDNIKRRGCTCVIVAHRLSAIRDCDEIIVMESGKIVQRGCHEKLSREKGHYQLLMQNM